MYSKDKDYNKVTRVLWLTLVRSSKYSGVDTNEECRCSRVSACHTGAQRWEVARNLLSAFEKPDSGDPIWGLERQHYDFLLLLCPARVEDNQVSGSTRMTEFFFLLSSSSAMHCCVFIVFVSDNTIADPGVHSCKPQYPCYFGEVLYGVSVVISLTCIVHMIMLILIAHIHEVDKFEIVNRFMLLFTFLWCPVFMLWNF